MPTYHYRCTDCGAERDVFCRVSEMDTSIPECHAKPMLRQIQPVWGYVQSECHYKCPVTGKGVTSWKQRREIMASNNLVDMSDYSPQKEIAKAQAKKEENAKLAAQMPFYGHHPENFT